MVEKVCRDEVQRGYMKHLKNLPDSSKSCMRHVLTLFDLSIMVSVPTSNLPTSLTSNCCFSIKLCSAVRQMELMSSLSPQKPIFDWPKPIVYLPDDVRLKLNEFNHQEQNKVKRQNYSGNEFYRSLYRCSYPFQNFLIWMFFRGKMS